MSFLFLTIWITWIICIIAGYNMGNNKKMGGTAGLLLGLTLGIIGLLIIALSADANETKDYNYNAVTTQSYNNTNAENKLNNAAADELQKWFELKEKGAITNEEFEQKKQKLLIK